MKDPYSILGISANASDDEVKTAYRQLAKKYHPDNYVNNPLSNLAEEKMREINEAYDAITNMRKNNSSSQSSRSYYSSNGSSNFSDVRRLIDANKITEAQEVLEGCPDYRRDAEWHFLIGCVYYKKGWLSRANNEISIAVNMEPNNREYREAYNRIIMQSNNQNFGGYRTNTNAQGCSGCDMCTSLICADCCCECMGGGLISCC